jgi:peptide-methionine (S)-S-oxide reductase
MLRFTKPLRIPTPAEALPGRGEPLEVPPTHFVNGHSMRRPYPEGLALALFGMGCFWGAEKTFWSIPSVYVTAVGYAGGPTPNPTYEEVCSGSTGHTEVVRVVYDSTAVRFEELLKVFWENHDPTQGMRQGNDVGTQYRSAAYWYAEKQRQTIESSRAAYERALMAAGYGAVTTEIAPAPAFTSPRATTSSTWRRIPAGIAASAARA